MGSQDTLIAIMDSIMPGRHALTVLVVGALFATAGALLWISRLLSVWRKDRREERESAAEMMGHLLDQQREELKRVGSNADALRGQVTQFVEGRWAIQRALDDIRDQLIAARVMIHDYERRIGLPETQFPPLPTLAVIPRPA